MFYRLFTYIESVKDSIDNGLVFITVGFLFPFLLFSYRSFSILQDKVFNFQVNIFSFGYFKILGVIAYCYLPPLCFFLIFYLFFSEKCFFIFEKILSKCNIIFLLYCQIAKIEQYFYKNIKNGTFVYILYLASYIYSLYYGSFLEFFFMASRTFLLSYYAFKKFFFLERDKKK